MKLIKLDAIDSTNEFLKGLSNKQELENFTVVTAENQTKGKGQMGSVWTSEQAKNLIMSVFVRDLLLGIDQIYHLNVAMTLAVIQALESFHIPALSIKWPNDIMSYNFKIAGILIENSLKSDGSVSSIVGLGLNVNQINFDDLPKASSLAVICGTSFDKEEILFRIVEKMKNNLEILKKQPDLLWMDYRNRLFKKAVPMPFKDNSDRNFMGIIQGVSPFGKLQLLLEDDSIVEYNIKEIQMLY
ncbi:biotin--[acetyl-CoA-carboxylase] ligase [Flavobacterium granuli]|uniref:BirA family biotin operon repressor/biotin-[acetyl-CoA-carboxylase] ligase n=1 Tax=Flavobacterium granuli TaxID=280093 RepID=A0A1M5LQX8_9FLAO|nr:biotin--[acetyl-CoA-carboxylase] ligase [Flavobacterium granuli]PRZ24051.1 BirA family biotin operon repressor/biotin-[acetyl-CoA-carboxylase] ligase [Flavobacterium granuli]SHG66753.1 BirA family transcriptional regulator, biotin operon repressor / biotin-[acetyl-CoA-carboxylase] ligase [Flavobacterium granuli]